MTGDTLHAFVKEAVHLCTTDEETPDDYVVVRAAVQARFPEIQKLAVSVDWVRNRVAYSKASPERLQAFAGRMKQNVRNMVGQGHSEHATALRTQAKKMALEQAASPKVAPTVATAPKTGYSNRARNIAMGVGAAAGTGLAANHMLGEKSAGAASEIAGLGMLAVPSVQHLRGKDMSENSKSKWELAGLGTLAAPYAVHGMRHIGGMLRR